MSVAQIEFLEKENERHGKNIHELRNSIHQVELAILTNENERLKIDGLQDKIIEAQGKEITMLKSKLAVWLGIAGSVAAFVGSVVGGYIVKHL